MFKDLQSHEGQRGCETLIVISTHMLVNFDVCTLGLGQTMTAMLCIIDKVYQYAFSTQRNFSVLSLNNITKCTVESAIIAYVTSR